MTRQPPPQASAAAATATPPAPPATNAATNAAVNAAANGPRLREDLLHPDPLLDCLLEICRVQGVNASRASLSAGLPLQDGRLTLDLVDRAAARVGFATRLVRLRPSKIDPNTLPAIMLLEGNEACVLLGWTPAGDARVLLPETGQGAVVMPRKEFSRRHSGVVLFVRPHFRFDERTPEVRATRSSHWFWGAIMSQRGVYRERAVGGAADQPVRAGLPDLHHERLRPRGAQPCGRNALGHGHRPGAGAGRRPVPAAAAQPLCRPGECAHRHPSSRPA